MCVAVFGCSSVVYLCMGKKVEGGGNRGDSRILGIWDATPPPHLRSAMIDHEAVWGGWSMIKFSKLGGWGYKIKRVG